MTSVSEDRRTMAIALSGAVTISFAPLLYSMSDTNPLTGAFFRMAYAIPFLVIIAYYFRKKDHRDRKSRSIAVVAGVLLAIDFLGYHSAIDYVGTGIATMVGNSQVIIVTLVSWKLFGEKPNRSILFALPMVIFGLVLISGIWDNEPYGEDPIKGVIGGVVAAILYSSFLIVYRYANRVKAPSPNLQLDATFGATMGIFFLGLLPLRQIGIEPIDFHVSWPGHAWLLLLAISCQIAGWIAITYALPRLPGAHTSFAVLLQPVLTFIWGVILLDENPSILQSAGMILILVAIVAVSIFGEARSENKAIST